MSDDNQQPIIIKKVNKGHGGHHGGSWKVAFADFMTAMMAFFLVMWLVGQSEKVRENVSLYFKDPGKYNQMGRAGVLKGSTGAIKLKEEASTILAPSRKKDFQPTSGEKQAMKLAAKNMLAALKEEKAFGRLKKNVKIQVTSEGLRVVLNENEDAPAFFEPGSAKLLQQSAIILVTIAKQLGQLSNQLVIEGHTDAGFTGDREYSNWELSADRANSARQLMEVSGLWDGQIREVRGFADQLPMLEHAPNDPRNRRVSIVVLYESRSRQLDEIAVGSDIMAEL
jgi:chemotaxis protein MotB